MEYEDEVRSFPPWREAVKQFVAAGFKAGDIIDFHWLYAALGIEEPDDDAMTGTKCKQLRLRFLAQFTPFRDVLLSEHQICLGSETGQGYVVVPPGDQVGRAYANCVKEVRKEFRRAAAEMTHVDASQLTSQQRREQVEALAQLCRLREIEKAARKPLIELAEE